MKERDRADCVRRYEERLDRHGYSPEALGWGGGGRQEVRFSVLADGALSLPDSSVLDVGCGFADLYEFLSRRGWKGSYRGIDIVPGLLDVARRRHPGIDVRLCDIAEYAGQTQEKYDFVVASGLFNYRLQEDDQLSYMESTFSQMRALAGRAVCADFMSTNVDYRHNATWHTDPGWAAAAAGRLTSRFLLRHDYMPYEFSLILFADEERSERNVFTAAEEQSE